VNSTFILSSHLPKVILYICILLLSPSIFPSHHRSSLRASHFRNPVAGRHLWAQVFVRAQGRYLLPNSYDYPGKSPKSDTYLCVWWRRAIGQIGREVGRKWVLRAGGYTPRSSWTQWTNGTGTAGHEECIFPVQLVICLTGHTTVRLRAYV
jgi:hypothetical protein